MCKSHTTSLAILSMTFFELNILQVELVGKFCSVPMHKVPRAADIEDQV